MDKCGFVENNPRARRASGLIQRTRTYPLYLVLKPLLGRLQISITILLNYFEFVLNTNSCEHFSGIKEDIKNKTL